MRYLVFITIVLFLLGLKLPAFMKLSIATGIMAASTIIYEFLIMKKCPNCGTKTAPNIKKCPACKELITK